MNSEETWQTLQMRSRLPLATSKRYILHIDPSHLVLRLIRTALIEPSDSEAEVIGFVEPNEASRYLIDHPEFAFDLAIIDADLTGDLGAYGIIAQLQDKQPKCPVILTRYRDSPNLLTLAEFRAIHHLYKPFRADQLHTLIGRLLTCRHDS